MENKNFLLSLSITLATILIGLISYIVYTQIQASNKVPLRCPYQGWSYEDGENFEAGDGCNMCICNDGEIACTEMACEDLNLDSTDNGGE